MNARPNITAFRVCDYEQVSGSSRRDNGLKREIAGSTVPLEERDLRLDDADPTGRRFDNAKTELSGTRRRVREPPLGEKLSVWIDPEAQLSVGAEGCMEAISEARA